MKNEIFMFSMNITYNIYLFSDPSTVKMSSETEQLDSDFETMSRNYEQVFDSNANSSDSEQDLLASNSHTKQDIPKRNKRKDFKPRCSMNISDTESPEIALNLSEHSNNNNNSCNVNVNVRRRKTLSTRKLVLESHFTPIDLSRSNRHEEEEEDEDEDSSGCDSDSSNGDNANCMKIPSSFSINHLAKPHVSDFGSGSPSGSQARVEVSPIDMRDYTVNTMRELLGIYATSEVAESIIRQLPIAAFSSGKCEYFILLFERLNKQKIVLFVNIILKRI